MRLAFPIRSSWRQFLFFRPAETSTLVLSAVLTGVLGFIDFVTGNGISIAILYMIPIGIAAWFGSARTGLLIAIASAAVWYAAETSAPGNPFSKQHTEIVNFIVLLATFAIVASLLSWAQRLNTRLRVIADRRLVSLSRKTAENRLLQRDIRMLFGLSQDLICTLTSPGVFRFINPAWISVTGHTEADLLGVPVSSFIPATEQKIFNEAFEAAQAESAAGRAECRFRCADGSFRVLQWMMSAEGNHVYAIAHDITEQRNMERQMIETADRENQRIGMDLHDGLCQRLKGVELILETVARSNGTDSGVQSQLSRITGEIRNAISEARNLSTGLSPVRLTADGLSVALKDLATNTSRLYRVECQLALPFGEAVLVHDNAVACQLYRIAQEAVSNAARHSKAEAIIISLKETDHSLRLEIRDNGMGISHSEQSSGSGINILRYRANLIGATLEIGDAAGGGTCIACTLPINSPQNSLNE